MKYINGIYFIFMCITLYYLTTENVSINTDSKILNFDGLKIDISKHQVSVNDSIIDLTFSEFEILSILAQNPGLVYTRSQIIDSIRGDNYPATDRTIDFQIVGLRKKLSTAKKYIKTIRGIGYKFNDEED